MEDRSPQLHELAARVLRCAAENDWDGLRVVDTSIAAMASAGGWSADERVALGQLRKAHAQALQHCRAQAGKIEQRLHDLCERRDGWLAYALVSGEWREDLI